jgi:alkaline phosphatase D
MPETRIRATYTRSHNVGLMTFNFDDGPRMSYTLHNTIGASVWDPLVLTPADLRNGVSTWRTKIDARELQRLERYRAGGSYFDPDAPL